MKKRLSTSLTFFWKYIFSTIWLGGFVVATIIAVYYDGPEGLVFLLGLAFSFVIIYYCFLRAKKVSIDDKYLYISNFKEEIKVPIQTISNVYENVIFNPRIISIEFSKTTKFGNRISFIGSMNFFLFFSPHPSLIEIHRAYKNLSKSRKR